MKLASVEKELIDITDQTQAINLIYPNQKDIPFIYQHFIAIIRIIGIFLIILIIYSLFYIPDFFLYGWRGSLLSLSPIILFVSSTSLLIKKMNNSINKQLKLIKLPVLTLTKTIHQIQPLKVLQQKKVLKLLVDHNLLANMNDYKRMDILINNLYHTEKIRQTTQPVSTFRIYMPVILIWFLGSILEPLLVDTELTINSDFLNNVIICLWFLGFSISFIIISEIFYRLRNRIVKRKNNKLYDILPSLIALRMEMERVEVIKQRRDNHNKRN